MQSRKLTAIVVVLASALMAFGGLPLGVSAAGTSVYMQSYFNVVSTDQISVKMILTATTYDAAGTTSLAAGQAMSSNLEFNSTTTSTLWANATRVGVAVAVQSVTYGALTIDNTGTTTCELNMSLSNATFTGELMRGNTAFMHFTDAAQAAGYDINNTSPWTIDASFTPGEATKTVWLNGNFSAVAGGTRKQNTIYINGSCS